MGGREGKPMSTQKRTFVDPDTGETIEVTPWARCVAGLVSIVIGGVSFWLAVLVVVVLVCLLLHIGLDGAWWVWLVVLLLFRPFARLVDQLDRKIYESISRYQHFHGKQV
jgi:type IV secretory pathway VirB2 component (pilin)